MSFFRATWFLIHYDANANIEIYINYQDTIIIN